jgi:uncharacterized repeat protein (TIGR02543 family)
MPAADVMLDPVWTPTYTVTYFPNVADSGIVPVDPNSYLDLEPVTVLGNTGSLGLAGHVFEGWNTQPDGSGTDFAPASILTISGANVNLYAQFKLDVSGGVGTTIDPYLIASAADLDKVRYDLDAHYRVDANIDLLVAPFDTTPGWIPIGTSAAPFTGTFDGGYPAAVISNLFIDTPAPDADGTGLFGKVSNATISGVALENVNIQTPVGRRVGALIGIAAGTTIVENSYVTGTLNVDTWSGGLIGNMNDTSVLRRSFADVSITGNDYTGGLVGQLKNGGATVEDSYAIGTIDSAGFAGALIAQVNGNDFVYRSYAAMVLISSADPFLSYNTGTTADNFFDVTVSNTGTPRGAVGLLTSEMMTQSQFSGWDFGSTWSIQEGLSYPYHQWYLGTPPTP